MTLCKMPLVIRQKSFLLGVLLKILDDDVLTRELMEQRLASSRTGGMALPTGVKRACEITLTSSEGIVSTILGGVEGGLLTTGVKGACCGEATLTQQSSVGSISRLNTG
jgi:hypothetical protein